MAERDRSREEQQPEEDVPGLTRDNIDIGTGLGGGLAPVLPTDIDGAHPDREWLASSAEDAPLPNWTKGEALEPGLERLDTPQPLSVPHDAHIVTVFGDDLGKVEQLYGYAPSNDPAWAAIKDGGRTVMVPLMSSQIEDDEIHVPYPKEMIAAAPEVPQHDFSVADEMRLYSHYNERRILPAADGYTQEQERTLHVVNRAA
jgi:hypothetical protein